MGRKLGKPRRMELVPRSTEVLKEPVTSHREEATGCQLAPVTEKETVAEAWKRKRAVSKRKREGRLTSPQKHR